jgi:putative two-component system response regulator
MDAARTPMSRPAELSPRILVVDDDEQARRLLGRVLEGESHRWESATSAEEARTALAEGSFGLVMTCINLPGESGLELAEQVLAEHRETAVLIVTGVDDAEFAKTAISIGVYGYVVKPIIPNEIRIAIANALKRRQLEIENRAHREALEQVVRARTMALERSAHQLKLTREEMARRLSRAVEYRDEETGGHTERMSRYCSLLARRAGLDPESIRVASPMHDVGKVAVPDRILLKPGKLTPDERLEMERHTIVGYEILSGSGSSLLDLAARIALTHHERFDGSGYPHRLAGDEIPLEGRVAAIADVFDALTTERSYRPAFSLEDASQMMREQRGRHFDPDMLDFFLGLMNEIVEIRNTWDHRLSTIADAPVAAESAALS